METNLYSSYVVTKTPWRDGTSAASRCVNSSGDMTRCVVPSRQAVLSLSTTWPGGVGLHAFVGQRRAGDVAAQLFQRLAVVGAAAHRSVQAETLCRRTASA